MGGAATKLDTTEEDINKSKDNSLPDNNTLCRNLKDDNIDTCLTQRRKTSETSDGISKQPCQQIPPTARETCDCQLPTLFDIPKSILQNTLYFVIGAVLLILQKPAWMIYNILKSSLQIMPFKGLLLNKDQCQKSVPVDDEVAIKNTRKKVIPRKQCSRICKLIRKAKHFIGATTSAIRLEFQPAQLDELDKDYCSFIPCTCEVKKRKHDELDSESEILYERFLTGDDLENYRSEEDENYVCVESDSSKSEDSLEFDEGSESEASVPSADEEHANVSEGVRELENGEHNRVNTVSTDFDDEDSSLIEQDAVVNCADETTTSEKMSCTNEREMTANDYMSLDSEVVIIDSADVGN